MSETETRTAELVKEAITKCPNSKSFIEGVIQGIIASKAFDEPNESDPTDRKEADNG